MVEEMKLEKKEKRNYILRCIFIGILGIMLTLGYLWIFGNAIENLARKDIDGKVCAMLAVILFIVLVIILCILIAFGIFWALYLSGDAMQKNIRNFQFNAEVDDFLNYLGNHEMQVKFKGLENLPEQFKGSVKEHKRTYFVRKGGPKELCVRVFKGKELVDYWTIDDYAFFFKYFEPIYSKEEV